jgi:hypothetical protein
MNSMLAPAAETSSYAFHIKQFMSPLSWIGQFFGKRANAPFSSDFYGKFIRILMLEFIEGFIQHLFPCPSTATATVKYPKLPQMLHALFYHTETGFGTVILALFYLKRLKEFHPSYHGSPGSMQRVIYTSVIVAAKYTCDDAYDNAVWSKASRGLFDTTETNRMEREFLYYLHYRLYVDELEWNSFIERLRLDIQQFLNEKANFIVNIPFKESANKLA